MPHSVVRLSNGLRLIHKQTDTPISHFGVLVNAGTRDEDEQKAGLAHFVEHTLFKGTHKRNAYHLLSRMETVGGDLNASTSKEETYLYTSFLSQEYPRAVELLSDILFHSTFPEKELEKEKTVVLEEIGYYQDTPSELIFDEFENLVFADHPLGRNILGTRQSVKKLTRQDILDFIAGNYTLGNVVLSSVGNIPVSKLKSLCERHFGDNAIPELQRNRTPFVSYQPQTSEIRKNTTQTNALLGNIAYPINDDRRTPFLLLTNILGGPGMNTRLNMGIREKKGLAYTIEASYTPFSDTGLFSIYFGCEKHHTEQCIDLIYTELKKLRENRLGTRQLFNAKKQFIGQMALSYETRLNEMLSLGHAAFFFEEIDTTEESMEQIKAITADEIIEVANETLIPDRFSTLIYHPR